MSYNTTVNNGDSNNRIDMVILGDGYQSSDFATLDAHANTLVDYMFTSGGALTFPFGQYAKFFNVHVVYTASNDSGTDDPGAGQVKDTAFDTTFSYAGGPDRLLYGSDAKANAVISSEFNATDVDAEMLFMAVNTSKYGGGGGAMGVYAGGNASALEVALHEIGHSFAGLADEYGGFGLYTGSDPSEANVTTDNTGSKWSHWLGYDQPGIGVIGAYDGGKYYNSGIYRPSVNSKMRALDNPFDVVSIEQFILKFYALVDPLDSWTDNAGTVTGKKVLKVDPIDSDVIDVEWSVNGNDPGIGDKVKLNLTKLGLEPGALVAVDARAYDPTEFVRINLDQLEMTISWQVEVPYYVNKINGNASDNMLTGVAWDDLIRGRGGNDILLGKSGNDQLRGEQGKDVLKGGTGQDTLDGGGGRDKLIGQGGKDTLNGGAKSDTLRGGKGNDTLTGGADADIFDFSDAGALGTDRITDFENGSDMIRMASGLAFGDLTIANHAVGTKVIWADGKIIIEGIMFVDIDANDFIF